MSVERSHRARRLGRRACARRRVRRRARMPNPRSAGNERATVPRRRTPGNGRRETPRRVESGAESRVDRARTFVGILRPFAVCRAGARDEEGEESGALRALGHVSPRVVQKRCQCWLYVQTNYPYETFFPRLKSASGQSMAIDALRADEKRGAPRARGSARFQTAVRVFAIRIGWRVGRDSRRATPSGARCSLPPPRAVPPRDGPPRAPRRCGRSGAERKSPRGGWR